MAGQPERRVESFSGYSAYYRLQKAERSGKPDANGWAVDFVQVDTADNDGMCGLVTYVRRGEPPAGEPEKGLFD